MSLDSKITTKQLGKELNTSQQNISHILKKALEEGKISMYETVIDPSRFGYDSFLVLLKIRNSSKRTLNKFGKLFKEHTDITGCYSLFGNYEILLKFTCLNASAFNKSFKKILQEIQEYIINFTILTQIVEYYATPSYISPKRLRSTILIGADRESSQISSKEKEILSQIQYNSRLSSSKIAFSLDTTAKTIIDTIKKLEQKEIIKGYTISYHPEQIGIEQYLLLFKISNNDDENDIVKHLKAHQNVTKIIKIFGEWDIIIQFETFSFKQLQESLETIKDDFQIFDYQYISISKRLFWNSMPEIK